MAQMCIDPRCHISHKHHNERKLNEKQKSRNNDCNEINYSSELNV